MFYIKVSHAPPQPGPRAQPQKFRKGVFYLQLSAWCVYISVIIIISIIRITIIIIRYPTFLLSRDHERFDSSAKIPVSLAMWIRGRGENSIIINIIIIIIIGSSGSSSSSSSSIITIIISVIVISCILS